jgi:hypothetical protein
VFDLLLNHTSEHWSFVTAQMNARSGLKHFGQAGADVIMKEIHQLNVMCGCLAASLSSKQKRSITVSDVPKGEERWSNQRLGLCQWSQAMYIQDQG